MVIDEDYILNFLVVRTKVVTKYTVISMDMSDYYTCKSPTWILFNGNNCVQKLKNKVKISSKWYFEHYFEIEITCWHVCYEDHEWLFQMWMHQRQQF